MVLICLTFSLPQKSGLLGIIHHDVEELQEKLSKQELSTDKIETEEELDTKSQTAGVRVLIVQDPLSRILSAFADEYKAKTGKTFTQWDASRRLEWRKVIFVLEL